MNAFAYRKIITPRRLKLDYVSPGICEGDFSSTGRQEISLLPLFVSGGPTGPVMEVYFGKYRMQWNRVPGALCYSVYRLADVLDPFSSYVLVAECIEDNNYLVDAGCYCVTAITPEGETECSDPVCTPAEEPLPPPPPYVPEDPPVEDPVPDPTPPPDIPGTCGDGTPAVPESLLVELETPELICSATAIGATGTAGTADFVTPSGRIATRYVSGSLWTDCTLKVPFPIPIKQNFINNTWLIHDGNIDSPFGAQFGCLSATGTPPECTPPVATQWATEYPNMICDHSLAGQGSAGPRTYSPTDAIVGDTQTFHVSVASYNAGCPNGGQQVMELVRTHGFLPLPQSLTIFNFESIKTELFCVTGAGAPAPQWTGLIADACTIAENGYQCIASSGIGGDRYVGDVVLKSANVWLVAGEKWTLQIIAEDPVFGFRVVWAGEKRYGQSPTGNYGRTGGCSSLGCVTLT